MYNDDKYHFEKKRRERMMKLREHGRKDERLWRLGPETVRDQRWTTHAFICLEQSM